MTADHLSAAETTQYEQATRFGAECAARAVTATRAVDVTLPRLLLLAHGAEAILNGVLRRMQELVHEFLQSLQQRDPPTTAGCEHRCLSSNRSW